jgi:hypothetical protein
MTMSGSAVIGQALGGPLIAADAFGTGWRSIFWVNVPVGVVALAGAAVLLPRESRGQARLDLPGVGLLTAAMALLVTPLAFGREQGWPAWTWACLGASVVAFAGFTGFERRRAARGGARPAYAFGVVTAALAASGFAGAACSFLSARRRAVEIPATRGEERIPARAR